MKGFLFIIYGSLTSTWGIRNNNVCAWERMREYINDLYDVPNKHFSLLFYIAAFFFFWKKKSLTIEVFLVYQTISVIGIRIRIIQVNKHKNDILRQFNLSYHNKKVCNPYSAIVGLNKFHFFVAGVVEYESIKMM